MIINTNKDSKDYLDNLLTLLRVSKENRELYYELSAEIKYLRHLALEKRKNKWPHVATILRIIHKAKGVLK